MFMPASGRKSSLSGLEPWRTNAAHEFQQWDLWFLAVLVGDYGGDWAALRMRLRPPTSNYSLAEEDAEAKLSHLDDLMQRVRDCGVAPVELIGDGVSDKRLLRK